MTRFLFAVAALLLALPASAAQGTDDIDALIAAAADASPTVEAAEKAAAAARAAARGLRAGPYEVQASGSVGRRTVDDAVVGDLEYTEWSAGLSRGVRLPGKRRADAGLAEIEIALADARRRLAREEAMLAFVDLWADWRAAVDAAGTARRLADDAARLAEAEGKALTLGAGRAIYVDQLRADAGLLALDAAQRDLDAENARARLASQFPGLAFEDIDIEVDTDRIEELLAAPAPDPAAVEAARLALQRARSQARRARLDRVPDPTVGVSYGNEFGGRETSVMATLSVPIGGRSRAANAKMTDAAVGRAAAELRVAELEATRRLGQYQREAMAAGRNLKQAEAAMNAARSASSRLQDGYDMKAVGLGELTAARRNLAQTETELTAYRAKIRRSFLRLLVIRGDYS